jgi:hypothetical protein
LQGRLKRLGGANVGVSCGPSGVAVVDVDDPRLIEPMLDRFGPTPLIVSTPRGGVHLYYDKGSSSVRSLNLRNREGLDVDIRADGGLAIVPPSRDAVTGSCYTFLEGTFACLSDLPKFRIEALGGVAGHAPPGRGRGPRSGARIPRGQRNNDLFRELLKHAPHCDDFDAVLDVARTRNAFAYEAPLPDAEVVSTAQSVWRYEREDRNWVGRAPRTIIGREELLVFAAHKNGGNALLLWAYLEGQHARRAEPLVLDREAMAEANLLPGWSAWRYRQAVETLRELGLLEIVGGGYRRGDQTFAPYLHRLKRPVAGTRQDTTRTGGGGPTSSDEGEP